jgi:hypothetical protein
MDKDGHWWWPLGHRIAMAQRLAVEKGRTAQERESIQARLLRKWMGK